MRFGGAPSMQIDPRIDLQPTLGEVALLPAVDRSDRTEDIGGLRRMLRHGPMFDGRDRLWFGSCDNDFLARVARPHGGCHGSPELQLFRAEFASPELPVGHVTQTLAA